MAALHVKVMPEDLPTECRMTPAPDGGSASPAATLALQRFGRFNDEVPDSDDVIRLDNRRPKDDNDLRFTPPAHYEPPAEFGPTLLKVLKQITQDA